MSTILDGSGLTNARLVDSLYLIVRHVPHVEHELGKVELVRYSHSSLLFDVIYKHRLVLSLLDLCLSRHAEVGW